MVQWCNGASFDNVLLRQSYKRTSIPCRCGFRNDRNVRTIVELGKAVGINPHYDIPFEWDLHNAQADAKHQAKYVSDIWQSLIRYRRILQKAFQNDHKKLKHQAPTLKSAKLLITYA